MDEATKHKLIWGWLRLFLGLVQMFFAAAGVFALLTLGLHSITYFCLTAATLATITSRFLYQGRADAGLSQAQKVFSTTSPTQEPGEKDSSKG